MADPDFPKSCFVSQGEEYILRKNNLPSPPLTFTTDPKLVILQAEKND